ncbi:Lipopolysaccharide biosynthesis protein WzxC [Lysobacter dokdonensis DS-58]|uniref:Lipopolysaccharide biosynthesis protein WzxC n=1 Tax=Lysobacter dokdonensis DS-58 TaxID=1300345 RepID=A0A0A2WKP7_9GAMM|nr:MOP flippase family protein [Lysobacter dokdonensis]KGQ18850.1 Lipopolysaccharide biosynthesis protein WzxC [Lysobacter dokdonensis DS-58]
MTLRARAISAGRWTSFSAVARSGLQVLQVAVVARFIAPADFGLMALTMAVVTVASLVAEFGIGRAIIHYDDADIRTRSTLYWITLALSAVLSLAIVLAAPLIASLYGKPELGALLAWTAPVLLLTSLGQQFVVVAEKELRFAIPAQNEVVAGIVGFIVCVVGAVAYRAGAFALVAAALASAATSSALAWLRLSHGHRPHFHFDLGPARPFLRMGRFLVGENLVSALVRQADVFVGGFVLSTAALGLFSLPRDLSLRMAMVINQVAMRVGFPVMSRVRHDVAVLRDVYLQMLRMTASVNFPVYVMVGVFADEIVMLLYGAQFRGASDLLRGLSAWGLVRSIANPTGSLLYAVGRVRLAFWWNVAQLVLLPAAYWFGGRLYGADGLVAALIVTQLLLMLPSWRYLVWPCCGATLPEFMRQLAAPFVAAVVCGAAAHLATFALPHGLLRLAVGGVMGGTVYLALSALLNRRWMSVMRDLALQWRTPH